MKTPLTAAVLKPDVRERLVEAVVRGHAPVQVVRGIWVCLRCDVASTLTQHSPFVQDFTCGGGR